MNDSPAPAAPKTYRISKASLPKLDALVADLKKKADKLGCAPPGYTVTNETTERRAYRREGYGPETGYRLLAPGGHLGPDEVLKIFVFVDVEPVGEAPRINGYRLAARLEHGPAGNIIFSNKSVGAELPMRFRSCAADCEHCNTKRNRADTFVLISDNGAFKLVGRSCLKDFLGHASPDALILAADWIDSLHAACADEESFGGGGGGKGFESLDRVLAIAANVIRLDGWVSRAREEASFGAAKATSGTVSSVLYTRRADISESFRAFLAERGGHGEADKAHAAAAREWAKGLPADGSEYESNLRTIAHNDHLDGGFGIAVSMVAMYDRHMGALNEAERAKSKKGSAHVGEVGKRSAFKVEVESVRPIASEMYGTSYLVTMRDPAGNVLKSFMSAGLFFGLNPSDDLNALCGKHLRGLATVKKHGTFSPRNAPEVAINETVLTRCKFSECAADAPAEDPKPAKGKRARKTAVASPDAG